jgi:LPXTG-motif cell wall-anchored protein
VDLRIPVNVSGNQITVIGQDNTTDASGSSSTGTPAGASSGGATTTGESGILSGNQTGIGVQLPVNASGNQVTVIGQDNVVDSTGSSTTGGSTGGSTGPTTSGEDGFGSGNQTGVGVTAPITATGNQVTVIGQDNTLTSTGTTTTGGSTGPGGTTTGEGGGGSGNQTPIDVQAPVDTSGNQVTVIGQDNTDTSTSGSTSGGTTPGGSTPPGGTVVSPPSTGSGTGSGTQAASAPGDSALPNTGAPAGMLGAGLLGLLLVLLGGAILRREEAMV